MNDLKQIISVSLILFSVIDIVGSIPVIIDLKKKAGGHIQSGKATLVAGLLMVLFLFVGESLLDLFHLDVASFAVAGAIVIFLLGLEMVLGVSIFKEDESLARTASVVHLLFGGLIPAFQRHYLNAPAIALSRLATVKAFVSRRFNHAKNFAELR